MLGVIAGIFITPDGTFTSWQAVLLLAALVVGFASVFLALRVMRAKHANIGPDASKTVDGTRFGPADFNRAVAGSLAKAVGQQSELTKWKGERLNLSIDLAAVTILLLALSRIIGGLE